MVTWRNMVLCSTSTVENYRCAQPVQHLLNFTEKRDICPIIASRQVSVSFLINPKKKSCVFILTLQDNNSTAIEHVEMTKFDVSAPNRQASTFTFLPPMKISFTVGHITHNSSTRDRFGYVCDTL